MLKNTTSDTPKKGAGGQGTGPVGQVPAISHGKREQYHKGHKGRVRPAMKADDNGDYGDDGEGSGIWV